MSFEVVDPDGNVIVVETAEEADALVRSGAAGVRADAPVALRRGGELIEVSPNELEAAFDAGFQLADREAFQAAETEAEFTTAGQTALAGVEGAARTATLGLSDAIIADIGGEGASEALEARREFNPGAATAGEVVGGVAPLLIPGGQGGALGALGRALSAPARATARVAQGVEGTVAAALRARGLGQGASRVAGTAAAGLVEGAALGTQQAITNDALENQELTAESLLASVQGNALWGAGAGAILGTGVNLARSTAVGAQRAGERGRNALGTLWRRSQGTDLAEGVAEGILNDTGRIVRLAENADEIRATTSGNLRRALDADEAVSGEVRDFAVGSLKASRIRRAIGRTTDEVQEGVASEANRIANRIAEVDEELSRVGFAAAGNRMKRALQEIQQDVRSAAQRGEVADTFGHLDRFKRRLGQVRKRTRDHEAGMILESFYDDVRRHLEVEDLYGEAARIQKQINPIWHEHLANLREFENRFLARSGVSDGFAAQMTGDPRKLSGFARNVGNAEAALDEEVFLRHIDTRTKLNDAISEFFDVPPQLRSQVAENKRTLGELRKQLDEARNVTKAVNQYRRLKDEASRSVVGKLAAGAAGAVGGAVGASAGGVVGGLAGIRAGEALGGAAARRVVDPIERTKLLTALQRGSDEQADRMARNVRAYLREGKKRAKQAARRAKPVVRRAAVLASSEEYEKRVEEVEELAGNPGKLAGRVGERIAAVEAHAPEVANAATMVGLRQLQFLQTRIPPGSRQRDALDATRRTHAVSPTERARFLRYVRAVENPLEVLSDLKDGTMTSEQVETLQEVYPQLYNQLVTKVMTTLSEEGSAVDFQSRIELGLLLGVPTDRSLEPQVLATLQQAAQSATAAQPQSPTAPSGGPQIQGISTSAATTAQRLEGGTFSSEPA